MCQKVTNSMSVSMCPDVSRVAAEIEKIAGDDEIISKIVLSYLRELEEHLDRNHAPSDHFYQNIITAHWPYSAKPPTAAELGLLPREDVRPPPVPPTPETSVQDNYLTQIQKALGKKVKGEELVSLCRFISKQLNIPLHKKSTVSKARLLAWLSDYDANISPRFSEFLEAWISSYFAK